MRVVADCFVFLCENSDYFWDTNTFALYSYRKTMFKKAPLKNQPHIISVHNSKIHIIIIIKCLQFVARD